MSLDEWLDREICKVSQHGTCERDTHYNKEHEGEVYCMNEEPRFPCKYQTTQRFFVSFNGRDCNYLQQCTNPRYKK